MVIAASRGHMIAIYRLLSEYATGMQSQRGRVNLFNDCMLHLTTEAIRLTTFGRKGRRIEYDSLRSHRCLAMEIRVPVIVVSQGLSVFSFQKVEFQIVKIHKCVKTNIHADKMP